ncbi:hypothetical protein PROFUN_10339 [Planoprotostelium fungivorum]|uniref:WWE domain-containing protein n=1 Tax=Planoprotostelium fungivorum TaxID=1890364 RepID=A0A2P6NDX2_9EUKA|nr:hypothetical protein PROFUN_10339 [Planoprotostelium fungivorum]
MPSAMLRTASGNIVTEKENKPAKKPAYSKLILPALHQLNRKSSRAHPTSVPALVKWVSLNYDLKDQRRAAQCIRKAVLEAVKQKRIKQIRQSFILTKAKTNKREVEKKVQAPRKRARREVDSSSKSEADDLPTKKTPAVRRARVSKKETVEKAQVPRKRARREDISRSEPDQSTEEKKEEKTPAVRRVTVWLYDHSGWKSYDTTTLDLPEIDLNQKRAEREGTLEKSVAPAAAGLKYDHLWQYEHNGWKNYDVKASDTVEEIYLDYLQNRRGTDVRAVKSGQWEYMVDFLALKQTNIQHEAHTIRSIRRVPVSK